MTEAVYPDALPALTRLHWYVLERVLGQGGFGITYLAKDTNLDQRVAIKEYLPIEGATRLSDGTVRWRTDELRERYRWGLERFIQEARTLARFDHPNIVRVLSVFEFNGTAYMVMRFEEGGTLSSLLDRRGTLPEAELLRVILPILDGLELVHNAGFIHRDIKPDNIHIGGDGRPVLLDFGSARQSLGSSNTLTILVAPGYAPFEQYYSDPSSQGPWTDIYGLGATCYRAICGRAPLDAVSRSKGILGSTEETMVPASVVGAGRYSGAVLGAIDHALAFAEKDRPQTIAQWRSELTSQGSRPAAGPTRAAVERPRAAPSAKTIVHPEASPLSAPQRTEQAPPTAASVRSSSEGGLWRWMLASAAILAIAVAVYVAMSRSDETQSKIATLEKQIRDKEAADAARAQKERQQAEEEARKRREQAAVDEAQRTETVSRQASTQSVPNETRKSATKPLPPPAASAAAPEAAPKSQATKAPIPRAPKPTAEAPPASPKESPPAAPVVATVAPPAEPIPRQLTTAEQLADAERAMKEQRYGDALAILNPLAGAGNAKAEEHLGDAYAEGRGVQRDAGAAERWYEKAGLQGDTSAQLKLGSMYASGNGVARNNNFAYVWYGTAASLGSNAGKTERDKVGALLQPAEREQADKVIASMVVGIKKP